MALGPTEILEAFAQAGALRVAPPSLLGADTLLDLYGEDIRARAYVTHDPVLGEQMLRPDFTVPIVERHMTDGAEPARYCYHGSVWRKQDPGSDAPNEFEQIGYELFDRTDPAKADAEVFSLFLNLLPRELDVITGDIGLLRAAVSGLRTSERRRAALMRHLWRPARFRKLLDRYAGLSDPIASRVDLIVAAGVNGVDTVVEEAGIPVGLRSPSEVKTRIQTLIEDAREDAISAEEVTMIETLLMTSGSLSNVLEPLEKLASNFEYLKGAVAQFSARLDALGDTADLHFEGSFGLTNMEYYDGFVFAFQSGDRIVASGGRYDALTRVLGNGREIPAVGGIIRPDYLEGAT